MKPTLQPGVRDTAKYEATRDRTIDFMGGKMGMKVELEVELAAGTEQRLAAKAAEGGLA